MQTVHFLHIGKTGGSAIKAALASVADYYPIVLHKHDVRLRDIGPSRAAFTLRHPVTRFVSGFNSRFRKGQPAYNVPWREAEERAFNLFLTPNDLAEALTTGPHQEAARDAVRSITHLAQPLTYWMTLDGARASNVVWIGFQETLDEDFKRLKTLLALPVDLRLPLDDRLSHRAPADSPVELSDLARSNVLNWYADDVRLYETLRSDKQP